MITCRVYRDGALVDEGFDAARISDHLEAGDVVWVDLEDPAEHEIIVADAKPYFRDVYDNVYRALEFVDNSRETMTAALSAYQSSVGNQMNVIMKKLTAWAAILLVPTLIAGIYGKNFQNMPELEWLFGYPWALGLMVVSSTVLYLQFRKRDWL